VVQAKYLAGLSDDEADARMSQRGTVGVSQQTSATIRQWTENHPFLIQSLCSRLYANHQLRKPILADLFIDNHLADLFRIDIGALPPSDCGEPLVHIPESPLLVSRGDREKGSVQTSAKHRLLVSWSPHLNLIRTSKMLY
jgi:hypothetical protein